MTGFIADGIRLPSPSGARDDAALAAAWRDYRAAYRALVARPAGMTDQQDQPFYAALDEAQDRLLGLPAHTPQGAALKLRWLWAALLECADSAAVMIDDAPLDEALNDDWRHALLWRVIADLERMAG